MDTPSTQKAKVMAREIGTRNANREAAVNASIIDWFNAAQDLIRNEDLKIQDGSCLSLHTLSHQIIHQMTVPLLQNLIKYMRMEELGKMWEYTFAVSSSFSRGCNFTHFDDLFDSLAI